MKRYKLTWKESDRSEREFVFVWELKDDAFLAKLRESSSLKDKIGILFDALSKDPYLSLGANIARIEEMD